MTTLILRLHNRMADGDLIYINFDHVIWFEDGASAGARVVISGCSDNVIHTDETPEQIMALIPA